MFGSIVSALTFIFSDIKFLSKTFALEIFSLQLRAHRHFLFWYLSFDFFSFFRRRLDTSITTLIFISDNPHLKDMNLNLISTNHGRSSERHSSMDYCSLTFCILKLIIFSYVLLRLCIVVSECGPCVVFQDYICHAILKKTPVAEHATNKIPDYHARSRASATSHLARANKSKRGKTSSTQPAPRRNEHTWWIETAQPEYFWLWKNVGENRRPYLRRPPKPTFYTATSFDLKLASLSPTFDFASGHDSFFAARPLKTKAVSRSSRRNACMYLAENRIL